VRRTLTISVLLLVLGGCASQAYDNDFSGWEISNNKIGTIINYGSLYKFKMRNYGYKINENSFEILIKTDGFYRFDKNYASCRSGMFSCLGGDALSQRINQICRSSFSSELQSLTSPKRNEKLSTGDRDIWDYPIYITAKCQNTNDYRIAKEKQDSLLKEQALKLKAFILEEKKNKCREYGFKDDTDGMGLCLIELDKLAKLEEQILAIEKRNNQVYLQNQQQIADQKRQREAQALINLGAVISGTGTPRRTTPKAPITTYPNSFSSTLTVPSNQICPILSTPITKQEVRGTNRICYYQ